MVNILEEQNKKNKKLKLPKLLDINNKKFKQEKDKKEITTKTVNKLKVATVVLVVLLLTAIAAAQFGGVTFSTVADYIVTAIARIGAGDGYPYQVSGDPIIDATITKSDIVLLYDDSVKILNSTAKELSDLPHDYDHPKLKANSGRVLLYEQGGKKLRVQSKTRVLYEKEMENIIYTAAIGKDGTVAVGTRANNAETKLTVFDSNQKAVFIWECANEYIVSCDVSDNGKYFVVSAIGVKNGAEYSKVHIFNRKESSAVASFQYDSAITSVEFLSNETVMIMGKSVCEIINEGQVSQKIDVSVHTPSKLFISDNNTAILVLSRYSSTTQKIIKVYNKAGEELFSTEIDGLVKSVSTDGKYIAVLTDKNVQIFNQKGEMTGFASVNADAGKVLVSSRNTYVYSADRVDQYSSVEILK